MPIPKNLGIATREAIGGAPVVRGDLVAQWVSLVPSYSPLAYRKTGGRPLIYLESHLDERGYNAIRNGIFDDRLRELRQSIPGNAIIRWDHEMTGPPNEWRTWGRMNPGLYIDTWRYVSGFLGPMHWCPSVGPENFARYRDYWPGDEFVSFAGFDAYDSGDRTPIPDMFKRPTKTIRDFTNKRILVGEFGSARLVGVGGRLRWLRTLRNVEDIWGAVYFNLDMSPKGPNWVMTPAMWGWYMKKMEAI